MNRFWKQITVFLIFYTGSLSAIWGFNHGHCYWDDPQVGPEFMMDTSIVYGPAEGNQFYSAIAFDGTNWLVVWTDRRGNPWSIFGTRVNQDGVVLDSSGIPISLAADDQEFPDVAFDGTNYLVVWRDARNGGPDNSDVYGARVTSDGVLLDTAGIAVSTAPRAQLDPSVASDGINCLVVWEDYRNTGSDTCDIYGARVSADGTVLDTTGIRICGAPDRQSEPSLAFDGTNYLVAWGDSRADLHDIYGARVTPDGVVLDTAGVGISTAPGGQGAPSVAFGSGRHLIVWGDGRNGSYADIYGTRVDTSGTVLDPAGIVISTAFWSQHLPSVDFDGVNFLVAWQDERNAGPEDIYGARVSPNGTVLDSSGFEIANTTDALMYPSVGFGGADYLVAWQTFYDIYGSRVTPSAAVLDTPGMLISTSANPQLYPSLASGNTTYLAVWQDFQYDDIYGGRVSQTGGILDAAPIAICTEQEKQYRPSVAFDGVNYLAVWQDARNFQPLNPYDIYAARIHEDGTVLDPAGVAVCTAEPEQVSPSVAFGETCYLAVWGDGRGGLTSHRDIYGSRVSSDGMVLDTSEIPICTASDWQDNPSVAFDGSNWLVVWQDYVRLGRDTSDIYGARVAQDGSVLDTAGIAICTLLSSLQKAPSVAFDGANYLVVWEDYRNDSGNPDIYGARIGPDGTILDPSGISISSAEREQEAPSVTFDGVCWLVVWKDERHGRDLPFIYGARLLSNGTVLDPGGFPVSTSICSEYFRVDVERGSDRCLVTFSGFAGPPYGSSRILGVFVTETGVQEQSEARTQRSGARLLQNYPNPFFHKTHIRYQISVSSRAALEVYDVAGRLVKTLVDETHEPGLYHMLWDGVDSIGKRVPSGIYFCCLSITKHGEEELAETKRMVLVR